MRPAEFEGFYYLCPGAPADSDGWHSAIPYGSHPRRCVKCGRMVRDDKFLGRWIYAVEFLLIEEEPV